MDGQPKTDDKNLNRIIKQAKHELEQMIDTLPDAMVLVDLNGRIMRVNRSFVKLAGKRRFQDVIGFFIRDVFGFEDMAQYSELFKDTAEKKELLLQIKIDNAPKQLKFTLMPAGNNAEWKVIFVEDMEEEKKRAERLEQKCRKEAAQAVVCTLMHNVNQPLTVILITAQMIKMNLNKEKLAVEEIQRNIESIIKNTLQVGGIIKSLEHTDSFVTEKYIGNTEMFDVRASFMAGLKRKATTGTGPDVLSRLMEAHVPGYLVHAERTAQISEFIARKMGLKEKDCSTAMSCGYYHDIGKIGIPDKILCKPSHLDPDEMAIMQSHCVIGKEFISQFPFMEDEAEVAWNHHERPDGKGYPRGIKENDISLFSRIVSVADCYEVIRGGRPYAPARDINKTISEMRNWAGTQISAAVFAVLEQNALELETILTKDAHEK